MNFSFFTFYNKTTQPQTFETTGGSVAAWHVVGATEGVIDGTRDGVTDGVIEGPTEGAREGVFDGPFDGAREGVLEGPLDGPLDGLEIVGVLDGA